MKTMKKVSALVLVLIMAMTVLAGCGGNSGGADEQGIKDVTAKFQKCMNDLDILGIYDCIEPEAGAKVKEQLETSLEALGMSMDDFKESEYYTAIIEQFESSMPFDIKTVKLEISNIKIDGEKATADVVAKADGVEDETQSLSYVKVDGSWYIDSSALGM